MPEFIAESQILTIMGTMGDHTASEEELRRALSNLMFEYIGLKTGMPVYPQVVQIQADILIDEMRRRKERDNKRPTEGPPPNYK